MIIVTGAYGFIGSCLVQYLNEQGHTQDLIVVDDFNQERKSPNLAGKSVSEWIHRDQFLAWFHENSGSVDFIFHLGARTDTVDTDPNIFNRLNLNYSQEIWKICTEHQIPLVYASSAATYGDGAFGFEDRHDHLDQMVPLNQYAISKNEFDKWILKQEKTPSHWAGLKFFNVYGPNEYHKGRMASVVFHAYNQIRETGGMKLFKSHHPEYKDGHQKRDFIYVKDVVEICDFFRSHSFQNGLYNVGTGNARTFLDLVHATFNALQVEPRIAFIDTPLDIRENYQYFTEAKMNKLRNVGFRDQMTTLESGINDYVRNYLVPDTCY